MLQRQAQVKKLSWPCMNPFNFLGLDLFRGQCQLHESCLLPSKVLFPPPLTLKKNTFDSIIMEATCRASTWFILWQSDKPHCLRGFAGKNFGIKLPKKPFHNKLSIWWLQPWNGGIPGRAADGVGYNKHTKNCCLLRLLLLMFLCSDPSVLLTVNCCKDFKRRVHGLSTLGIFSYGWSHESSLSFRTRWANVWLRMWKLKVLGKKLLPCG